MTADSEGANTKVTRSTVVFALCAALNSCNLGYDIGVSTNAGPLVQSEFGLSDVQRELFLGSLNFWSIFGSVFSHWICDVLGRRRAFQVAAIHFIIGVLILSVANGFATLMAGRFFLGIGVGFGLAVSRIRSGFARTKRSVRNVGLTAFVIFWNCLEKKKKNMATDRPIVHFRNDTGGASWQTGHVVGNGHQRWNRIGILFGFGVL